MHSIHVTVGDSAAGGVEKMLRDPGFTDRVVAARDNRIGAVGRIGLAATQGSGPVATLRAIVAGELARAVR